jgi:hypothetical protein
LIEQEEVEEVEVRGRIFRLLGRIEKQEELSEGEVEGGMIFFRHPISTSFEPLLPLLPPVK